MGQEIKKGGNKKLLAPKMNISSEIGSSDPSGKIGLDNFVEVVQKKIYPCGFGLRNPINPPPLQHIRQNGNGPFYYKLITIHFLSANKSICTVLFKIQELLYEFVETKRVITKSYYPPCWRSPGF